mmetsp:Transcript_32182/g.96812  ORF Transcript_32182/g.96812 Transcript_32182/m.96812 type:complete len:347 (+) Transcript_32182:2649-3689(+)
MSSSVAEAFRVWPQFHNGVAAGLRLQPWESDDCRSGRRSACVTRTWIVYNRPKLPSPQHGGLLLALGLQGHLDVLAMTDIYEYLTSGHEHRLMTEFLLGEMSGIMHSDRICDREAYALAAGVALGMITLGKGGSHEAAGLNDLRISQRLHHAISGSRRGKVTCPGLVKPVRSDMSIRAGRSRRQASEELNTDMTAPGAILAMGLYYIQTNSAAAAAWLQLPDTQVLLNTVRPDLQLLRVVARAIILWNTIRPSIEWVESQLPEAVAPAPASFVSGVDWVHIGGSISCRRLTTDHFILVENRLDAYDTDIIPASIDCDTFCQARVCTVAGGCFVRTRVLYPRLNFLF